MAGKNRNYTNIILYTAALALAGTVAWFALNRQQTKRLLPSRSKEHNKPIPAEIMQWTKKFLEKYKQELLGFYINTERINHAQQLSDSQTTYLENTYGKVVNEPSLFIYMAYSKKFPGQSEQLLTQVLEEYLSSVQRTDDKPQHQMEQILKTQAAEQAAHIVKQLIQEEKDINPK